MDESSPFSSLPSSFSVTSRSATFQRQKSIQQIHDSRFFTIFFLKHLEESSHHHLATYDCDCGTKIKGKVSRLFVGRDDVTDDGNMTKVYLLFVFLAKVI